MDDLFVCVCVLSFALSFFIIFASSGAKKQKNGKLQFSSSFFHFSIMFLHVSSFLLPVVQTCLKHDKKMIFKKKKKRGKLQFSIFCRIFAPLEAKMMKNDKAMI